MHVESSRAVRVPLWKASSPACAIIAPLSIQYLSSIAKKDTDRSTGRSVSTEDSQIINEPQSHNTYLESIAHSVAFLSLAIAAIIS